MDVHSPDVQDEHAGSSHAISKRKLLAIVIRDVEVKIRNVKSQRGRYHYWQNFRRNQAFPNHSSSKAYKKWTVDRSKHDQEKLQLLVSKDVAPSDGAKRVKEGEKYGTYNGAIGLNFIYPCSESSSDGKRNK